MGGRSFSFEEYRNLLKERGYTLLISKEEYKGQSQTYRALCPKGHECNVLYSNLKKGSTCCKSCGNENRKVTTKAIYGTDYIGQNEEIKKKIKKNMMEKHGAEHPMNVPQFREKQRATLMKNHGVETPCASLEIREKSKATLMKNYGVESPLQSSEILERSKATLMRNYGVESPLQSFEIRERYKATLMKNYGVENPSHSPEILERIKATLMKNYGVENPSLSAEIREVVKETMLKRYGVENPMQVPEFFSKQQKSAFAYKEYKFPSGKIVLYQGYEHFCLDDLLEEGYDENDIINSVKEVPTISYVFNDTNRVYFPDIFIPKENKLIEIKSSRTMEIDLHKNLSKAKACVEQGYNYELRIYYSKGTYVTLNPKSYI